MKRITSRTIGLALTTGAAAMLPAHAGAQNRTTAPYEPQLDAPKQSASAPEPASDTPEPQAAEQSEPTISCFNAQSLQASLNEMIAPMSRAQQKSFMTGFFHYVYASRPQKYRPYGGVRVWGQHGPGDLAVFSANGFLNDGRMDDMSPARAYTAYGRSSGYSARASYNRFLDNYCANVEGMNRAELIALGSDKMCLKSLANHQESRGILGRRKLAKGCALPVLPIGK